MTSKTETTGPPSQESLEEAHKKLISLVRLVVVLLLLGLPAMVFIQAGRQIDLNQNLLAAIRRNDANTVKFLLSAGADANTQDSSNDKRPMLQKIMDRLRGAPAPKGNPALMIHLANKVVPSRGDAYTYEPAQPENVEIARALLEHHADPNCLQSYGEEYGSTPLIRAVEHKKDKTIQLLLQHGADVHKKDPQGFDALHHAVESAGSAEVSLLLDAGADPNVQDRGRLTPLVYAVSRQDVEIVKLLIAHGADVNAKDRDSVSVLTYAIREQAKSIIALLKAAGAK